MEYYEILDKAEKLYRLADHYTEARFYHASCGYDTIASLYCRDMALQVLDAASILAAEAIAQMTTPSPLDWRLAQVDDSGSRFTIQGGEITELDNRMRDASDDNIPF